MNSFESGIMVIEPVLNQEQNVDEKIIYEEKPWANEIPGSIWEIHDIENYINDQKEFMKTGPENLGNMDKDPSFNEEDHKLDL